MTTPDWIFKRQQPGDTTRDPISGEFFATEAIRNSAEALVREGIQNSMDAGLDGETVRVRILLSGDTSSAEPANLTRLFRGLRDHLDARGNGLRDDARPDLSATCRFLVFEDFGTRGLEGDPEQWHKVEGRKNKFYAFFRAEGESDKTDNDRRGRWGVGKFVFPRASTGSTFFGLTVRGDDGRRLLLGRSILKSHDVAGARYVPDGYFGQGKELQGGRLVVPVEEPAFLDQFCTTFRLERARQPGLSLVVPWYDLEITPERLVDACIRDWFFSIMAGELVITVEAPSFSGVLDAGSLEEHVQGLDSGAELEPLLELSRFALSHLGRKPIVLGAADTDNAPKWHEAMLPEATASTLREQLDSEQPIAVRIPIRVRRKRAPLAESWLDIFLMRDSTADDGRPIFVREGVIVSDAKGGRARQYRSLVVIDHKPLAELLGDAENPSHTEWRADTANFKDKYTYGPGYLTFVKQSVSELVSRIQATENDAAPDLLIDLFSLPISEDMRRARPTGVPEPPGQGPEPGPDLVIPRKPKPYAVTRVQGGFTISPGETGSRTPAQLEITVAYDVRRGDPFKRYDPADFRLFVRPVVASEEPRGILKLDASGNRVVLKVTDPDFRFTVSGFDVHRDLIIRVVAHGDFNDNQAA